MIGAVERPSVPQLARKAPLGCRRPLRRSVSSIARRSRLSRRARSETTKTAASRSAWETRFETRVWPVPRRATSTRNAPPAHQGRATPENRLAMRTVLSMLLP